MFKEFFLFEINYRLKRPMVYIFTFINFLLLFAATISENIVIGGSNDAIQINSPHVIMATILITTIIGIFMTTAIINTSILRDFSNKFDGILFSTPLKKPAYLGGRFLASFLIALIPFFGALAGIFVGSISPWVEATEVGPFNFSAYWSTFLFAVVPNTLLVSAVVFMLASTFRSAIVSFMGAIIILVLYVMMLSFMSSMDDQSMASLLDPLAISSYQNATKYWTIADKNTQIVAFTGPLLMNRLLWLAVSFILIAISYFGFSFSKKNGIFNRKNKKTSKSIAFTPVMSKLKALPLVNIVHNSKTTSAQFFHQAKMELFGILKSGPFMIILAFGIINMSTSILNVSELYGTGNYPVTYLVVAAIRNSLYLFLMAIVMFYSGEIIWRERDNKMNEFIDASPVQTWVPYISKFFALIGMTAFILSIAILCGIASQAVNGYTNFELGVYLKEFLVLDLMGFTVIIVLAMLIQTLVNNKYLGYFAFIVSAIALLYIPSMLEIKSHLFTYGSTPSYIYSDMNAWGAFTKSLAWFNAYWMLFAGLLVITGILFWVRGKSLTFSQRFNIAKQRFNGKIALTTAFFGITWLTTAGFLFYQTEFVNPAKSDSAKEMIQVEYENNFKKYAHIPQPRNTDIEFDITIYPNERNFKVEANVVAKNKTQKAIDKIHFTTIENLNMTIEIPNAEIEMENKELSYTIFKLDQPLLPGQLLNYKVTCEYISQGVENDISNTDIASNGTFLSNFKLMPTIGYSSDKELSNKNTRAEHNLPYKDLMKKLHSNCSESCQNTYISEDSDWVNVESTISTNADQIAIAPGTLMKEWKENDRNYYHYKLKKPVLNFYSFISGKYEIEKDVWINPNGKEISVEVYYHKAHHYNVDKMIKSLKNSLEYYSNNFGPYPHEEARIIEFPRYASFAQAFPGTMPYSEGIGFIANLNEKDAIDMVYYVVAHEMAHQWWAHQVIGANVQGSTMLSETFSQYSALMIMKKEYGADKMKQFMKYEMDNYLRGRGREENKELPLMFTENQNYIHYGKGSVVMYALQDYIGEERVNQALKEYATAVAYQEAPYTTSLEVLEYFEAVTPDSLQYLLDDMFRNITLYNNKTENIEYIELENGQYEITIDFSVEKYRADSLGIETLVAHNDYIDIGFYSKEKAKGEKYGKPILVKRKLISSKDNTFKFVLDELPYEGGIDPNYLLVDRFPEDNLKKLTLKD